MTDSKKQTNRRAARVALVASVAAALSLPLLTQSLHGQTGTNAAAAGNKPAAAAAPAAAPTAPTTSSARLAPDTVIASVGAVKVTQADFDTALSGQAPQQQAAILGSPDGRKSFADYLVKMKAVAAEAEKRGIDKDPKVQQQLAVARQNVLVQNLLVSLGTDEAANKKYFEQHPEQFGKVQARHILVSTRGSNDPKKQKDVLTDEQAKKKADEIRARLVKGEDFATIAKTESDDPGSKETGGTYTFGRGEMVPAFEQAAYSLKENEISQPVKTQFGYHVIQLQKHLPGTFEEAKQQVPAMRVDAFIKDLVGDVKFNDAFLNAGPVNPAAAPAPAPAPAVPAPAPAKK